MSDNIGVHWITYKHLLRLFAHHFICLNVLSLSAKFEFVNYVKCLLISCHLSEKITINSYNLDLGYNYFRRVCWRCCSIFDPNNNSSYSSEQGIVFPITKISQRVISIFQCLCVDVRCTRILTDGVRDPIQTTDQTQKL